MIYQFEPNPSLWQSWLFDSYMWTDEGRASVAAGLLFVLLVFWAAALPFFFVLPAAFASILLAALVLGTMIAFRFRPVRYVAASMGKKKFAPNQLSSEEFYVPTQLEVAEHGIEVTASGRRIELSWRPTLRAVCGKDACAFTWGLQLIILLPREMLAADDGWNQVRAWCPGTIDLTAPPAKSSKRFSIMGIVAIVLGLVAHLMVWLGPGARLTAIPLGWGAVLIAATAALTRPGRTLSIIAAAIAASAAITALVLPVPWPMAELLM
jgi:hypothetical protein